MNLKYLYRYTRIFSGLVENFGVMFQGCEREGFEFYMNIDGKRHSNVGPSVIQAVKTPKREGLKNEGIGEWK